MRQFGEITETSGRQSPITQSRFGSAGSQVYRVATSGLLAAETSAEEIFEWLDLVYFAYFAYLVLCSASLDRAPFPICLKVFNCVKRLWFPMMK